MARATPEACEHFKELAKRDLDNHKTVPAEVQQMMAADSDKEVHMQRFEKAWADAGADDAGLDLAGFIKYMRLQDEVCKEKYAGWCQNYGDDVHTAAFNTCVGW